MTLSKDAISEDAKRSSLRSLSSTCSSKGKVSHPPTLKGILKLLVVLVLYILVNLFGGYIFSLIEKKPTEGRTHWLPQFKQQFINNHSSCLTYNELEMFLSTLEEIASNDSIKISGNNTTYPEVWTLNNGFILAFTIASTIGYGLVTPITTGGQVFAIFFALFTIPFTGILAAKIGSIMAYYIKKASTHLTVWVDKAKVVGLLVTLLVGLLIYVILPSLLLTFVGNEEGWSFVNSLYCVIITLTTIGFGDYVPDPSSQGGIPTSIFVLVWVIAGLAWFATIIQLIATQLTKQAKTLQSKVSVTNPPLISRFNYIGKGDAKDESIEEVAGEDNNAVLLKANSLDTKTDYAGSLARRPITFAFVNPNHEMSRLHNNTSDNEEVEVNASFPKQRQTEDDKMSGPGSFHAVVMTHMQPGNERIFSNKTPHATLDTDQGLL